MDVDVIEDVCLLPDTAEQVALSIIDFLFCLGEEIASDFVFCDTEYSFWFILFVF